MTKKVIGNFAPEKTEMTSLVCCNGLAQVALTHQPIMQEVVTSVVCINFWHKIKLHLNNNNITRAVQALERCIEITVIIDSHMLD